MTKTTLENPKLKPCKACSKAVSKSADACPNCGEPFPGGLPYFILKVVIMLALLFGGVLAFYYLEK